MSRTHRGFAGAVVAAPLLWLLAEVVSPALKSTAADQLAVVAAHPDRWYVYTVLLVAGTIAFVPAVLGLMRLARSGSSKLATLGGVLLSFAAIVAVGDAMSQLFVWQMVKGGANTGQMAALLDRFDNAAGASVFFLPGGLAWLVGTVLLTIALVRTRGIPAWAGITFGMGSILQLVGFTAGSVPVLAASAVILLLAAVPLGRRLLVEPTYDATASHPAMVAA